MKQRCQIPNCPNVGHSTKVCAECKRPVCQRHAHGYAASKVICGKCWRDWDINHNRNRKQER